MSKKGVVERFHAGELGEWRQDKEHAQDIVTFFRHAEEASLVESLPNLHAWYRGLHGVMRCLRPYATIEERKKMSEAVPPRPPSVQETRRYRLPVDIYYYQEKIICWENVLRDVALAHGFMIRAGEADDPFGAIYK